MPHPLATSLLLLALAVLDDLFLRICEKGEPRLEKARRRVVPPVPALVTNGFRSGSVEASKGGGLQVASFRKRVVTNGQISSQVD
jgi:hypothetical protein